ncbi:DUF4403 family protein [Portibacter marinus]|uniref:DUF4403 family protein n=1 Tax=Portibacter marinus TaxID=2898660 RepID=UPI001F47EB95|nr:DUF4403 family protein [Portibacter marinus]
MTEVFLQLSYPQLSRLIQSEANKQEINVKGYDLKIDKLVINSEDGRLRITGQIVSKWDAYFDFQATPMFLNSENKLELQDIKLKLDATNLIFKGIIKLAKGMIKSRIEKILESPLTEQIEGLKQNLDQELSKAPLPHQLQLNSNTHHLLIETIQALEQYLLIALKIEQKINISFKDQEV